MKTHLNTSGKSLKLIGIFHPLISIVSVERLYPERKDKTDTMILGTFRRNLSVTSFAMVPLADEF